MAKTQSEAGPNKAFMDRLKKANKGWGAAKEKAAEAKSGGPTEFDDGRYMARLVGAKLGESAAGRLQVTFRFKFEDDDTHAYGGQEKYDYQGVESEQNLEFFARRIDQLGYEMPDDLTGIVDILKDIEATKPLCKIRIKTKGDFQNVYIDKVYGADDLEESDDEAEESSDEEEAVEEAPAAKPKKGAKATPPPAEEEEETDEEETEEEEEEEEEESGEEEDEVELTVGMTVVAETAKGERTGVVLEILADEGKARIKASDDGKVLRIALDKLSIPDDVPEEPAPAKGKKTKK